MADKWQPIETVPKGVNVLLGWWEWTGRVTVPMPPRDKCIWVTEIFSSAWRHPCATHWMPLPDPPQDEKERK